MTLPPLLTHVAALWAVTPEAPAHGRSPDESETEMTKHLHYITHTHEAGFGVHVEFTCTGDRTSPCHQYPPQDTEMETLWEGDRDLLMPHDECWLRPWMEDADCAKTCCPDGETVRSGPINVTWNGDCVEWEYVEPAVTPEGPERIEEWDTWEDVPEGVVVTVPGLSCHYRKNQRVTEFSDPDNDPDWTKAVVRAIPRSYGPWTRVTDV